eukprot:TRINITY_DN2384_c0_g1_i1.p1 TRINITY_DN2384_c0_g1~~TRINITY_DN2384_c0_g1_i1.p1  ORF type:complete len:2098 (+),score=383.45 TRINITY_DN2384_c0_g1_i1:66-6359(+)
MDPPGYFYYDGSSLLSDGPVPPPSVLRDMWKEAAGPPQQVLTTGDLLGTEVPEAAEPVLRVPVRPDHGARAVQRRQPSAARRPVIGPRALSAAPAACAPSAPPPQVRLAGQDAALRLAAHDALAMIGGRRTRRKGGHRNRMLRDFEQARRREQLLRPHPQSRYPDAHQDLSTLTPIPREEPDVSELLQTSALSAAVRAASPPAPLPEDAHAVLCGRIAEMWREVGAPPHVRHCAGKCRSVCQRCVRRRWFGAPSKPQSIHSLNIELARLAAERDALHAAKAAWRSRAAAVAALRNLAERYRVWGLAAACPARSGRSATHGLRELFAELMEIMRRLREAGLTCVQAAAEWVRSSRRREPLRLDSQNVLLTLCVDVAAVVRGEALQCVLRAPLLMNPFVSREGAPLLPKSNTKSMALVTVSPGTPRRAVAALRQQHEGRAWGQLPSWTDQLFELPQQREAEYAAALRTITKEVGRVLVRVQTCWRGFAARRKRRLVVDAGAALRRAGRGAVARWAVAGARRTVAATRLQAATRRMIVLRWMAYLARAATAISSAWHGHCSRRALARSRHASYIIQCAARRAHRRREKAAAVLQRHGRGAAARRYVPTRRRAVHAVLLMQRVSKGLRVRRAISLHRGAAAARLRRVAAGALSRRLLGTQRRRQAARALCRVHGGWRARRQLAAMWQALRGSAGAVIGRAARGYLLRRRRSALSAEWRRRVLAVAAAVRSRRTRRAARRTLAAALEEAAARRGIAACSVLCFEELLARRQCCLVHAECIQAAVLQRDGGDAAPGPPSGSLRPAARIHEPPSGPAPAQLQLQELAAVSVPQRQRPPPSRATQPQPVDAPASTSAPAPSRQPTPPPPQQLDVEPARAQVARPVAARRMVLTGRASPPRSRAAALVEAECPPEDIRDIAAAAPLPGPRRRRCRTPAPPPPGLLHRDESVWATAAAPAIQLPMAAAPFAPPALHPPSAPTPPPSPPATPVSQAHLALTPPHTPPPLTPTATPAATPTAAAVVVLAAALQNAAPTDPESAARSGPADACRLREQRSQARCAAMRWLCSALIVQRFCRSFMLHRDELPAARPGLPEPALHDTALEASAVVVRTTSGGAVTLSLRAQRAFVALQRAIRRRCATRRRAPDWLVAECGDLASLFLAAQCEPTQPPPEGADAVIVLQAHARALLSRRLVSVLTRRQRDQRRAALGAAASRLLDATNIGTMLSAWRNLFRAVVVRRAVGTLQRSFRSCCARRRNAERKVVQENQRIATRQAAAASAIAGMCRTQLGRIRARREWEQKLATTQPSWWPSAPSAAPPITCEVSPAEREALRRVRLKRQKQGQDPAVADAAAACIGRMLRKRGNRKRALTAAAAISAAVRAERCTAVRMRMAVRIQCAIRSFIARRRFVRKREHKIARAKEANVLTAARTIIGMWRTKAMAAAARRERARREVEAAAEKRRNAAALHIQQGIRGFQARQRRREKLEKKSVLALLANRRQAVRTIIGMWRTKVAAAAARRQFAEALAVRDRDAAALRIQQGIRGFLARRRRAEKREQHHERAAAAVRLGAVRTIIGIWRTAVARRRQGLVRRKTLQAEEAAAQLAAFRDEAVQKMQRMYRCWSARKLRALATDKRRARGEHERRAQAASSIAGMMRTQLAKIREKRRRDAEQHRVRPQTRQPRTAAPSQSPPPNRSGPVAAAHPLPPPPREAESQGWRQSLSQPPPRDAVRPPPTVDGRATAASPPPRNVGESGSPVAAPRSPDAAGGGLLPGGGPPSRRAARSAVDPWQPAALSSACQSATPQRLRPVAKGGDPRPARSSRGWPPPSSFRGTERVQAQAQAQQPPVPVQLRGTQQPAPVQLRGTQQQPLQLPTQAHAQPTTQAGCALQQPPTMNATPQRAARPPAQPRPQQLPGQPRPGKSTHVEPMQLLTQESVQPLRPQPVRVYLGTEDAGRHPFHFAQVRPSEQQPPAAPMSAHSLLPVHTQLHAQSQVPAVRSARLPPPMVHSDNLGPMAPPQADPVSPPRQPSPAGARPPLGTPPTIVISPASPQRHVSPPRRPVSPGLLSAERPPAQPCYTRHRQRVAAHLRPVGLPPRQAWVDTVPEP